MGHYATRTLRKGRIGKAPLEPDDVLRKKKRSTFHFRSEGRENIVFKLQDNRAVTVS